MNVQLLCPVCVAGNAGERSSGCNNLFEAN